MWWVRLWRRHGSQSGGVPGGRATCARPGCGLDAVGGGCGRLQQACSDFVQILNEEFDMDALRTHKRKKPVASGHARKRKKEKAAGGSSPSFRPGQAYSKIQ